ncbi:NUDIX domain-containing protein [Ktedonobacter sp. SOSP1-85]|uniref:NUDIX domain-containing protein n=1 Tax=Ktedonobacter sp. SOSP1-85 TaxID=2778367 RepID=UPI0035AF0204
MRIKAYKKEKQLSQECVEKVTAFITREHRGRRELLVFDHGLSGTQVPAGTVEYGEALEAAVLREVQEETGYNGRILQLLGQETLDLGEAQRMMVKHVLLRQAPSADAEVVAPEEILGNALRRGLTVRLERQQEGWAYVYLEEFNHEVEPPRIIRSVGGWVPGDTLSRWVRRSFFQVQLYDETPERWEQFAEGQYTFHLYWQPLEPIPHLVAPQQAWLARFYTHLFDIQ